MLKLSDIGQLNAKLQTPNLQNSKLWNKKLSDIKPIEIVIYQKQQEMQGAGLQAREQFEIIVAETIKAMLEGKVANAPFLSCMGQQATMTYGEFSDALKFSNLTEARIAAIMFSLESGLPPEEVVTLTWGLLSKGQFSEICHLIAHTRARHIKLNYVFWEQMEVFGIAGPLFALQDDFNTVFDGIPFEQVKEMYDRAPMVDNERDAAEFKAIVLSQKSQ